MYKKYLILIDMKVVMALLVILLGALYYIKGYRIGLIPTTPMYAFNAQGTTSYPFRLYGEGQLSIRGSCEVSSGSAVLNFTSSDGTPLGGAQCDKGKWSINMATRGSAGFYKVNVVFNHFTGKLILTPVAKTNF